MARVVNQLLAAGLQSALAMPPKSSRLCDVQVMGETSLSNKRAAPRPPKPRPIQRCVEGRNGLPPILHGCVQLEGSSGND
jgi:hypothetical protein